MELKLRDNDTDSIYKVIFTDKYSVSHTYYINAYFRDDTEGDDLEIEYTVFNENGISLDGGITETDLFDISLTAALKAIIETFHDSDENADYDITDLNGFQYSLADLRMNDAETMLELIEDNEEGENE